MLRSQAEPGRPRWLESRNSSRDPNLQSHAGSPLKTGRDKVLFGSPI